MRYELLKYNRIRNLRRDAEFTQEQMAEKLNIKQNSYSQYELGERNIPNEVLIKLALIFETSIDYLLGLTDTKQPYEKPKSII